MSGANRQHEKHKSSNPQHQDLLVASALRMEFLVVRANKERLQEQTQQQDSGQGDQDLAQEEQEPQASKQDAVFERDNKPLLNRLRAGGWTNRGCTDPPKSPLCACIRDGMTAMSRLS